jgi:hypothetical protein
MPLAKANSTSENAGALGFAREHRGEKEILIHTGNT